MEATQKLSLEQQLHALKGYTIEDAKMKGDYLILDLRKGEGVHTVYSHRSFRVHPTITMAVVEKHE